MHKKDSKWVGTLVAFVCVLTGTVAAWGLPTRIELLATRDHLAPEADRGVFDTRTALDGGVAPIALASLLQAKIEQPISDEILTQAQAVASPVVNGYDLAWFVANPREYVSYWRAVRNIEGFGKRGQSGIVSALLPYAIRLETPGLLQGINPDNLPKAFDVLNKYVLEHTGAEVDLRPEDFGIVVPSEKLSDTAATRAYIEAQAGYPMTYLFARQAVVDAFKAIQTVIAAVINLEDLKPELVAVLDTEAVMAIKVGPAFVPADMQSISAADGGARRIVLDALTKF